MPKPKDWIWFAENDLKAAKIIFKSNEPVIGPIVFHTQQYAEKAFKAYLFIRNNIYHALMILSH